MTTDNRLRILSYSDLPLYTVERKLNIMATCGLVNIGLDTDEPDAVDVALAEIDLEMAGAREAVDRLVARARDQAIIRLGVLSLARWRVERARYEC